RESARACVFLWWMRCRLSSERASCYSIANDRSYFHRCCLPSLGLVCRPNADSRCISGPTLELSLGRVVTCHTVRSGACVDSPPRAPACQSGDAGGAAHGYG